MHWHAQSSEPQHKITEVRYIEWRSYRLAHAHTYSVCWPTAVQTHLFPFLISYDLVLSSLCTFIYCLFNDATGQSTKCYIVRRLLTDRKLVQFLFLLYKTNIFLLNYQNLKCQCGTKRQCRILQEFVWKEWEKPRERPDGRSYGRNLNVIFSEYENSASPC